MISQAYDGSPPPAVRARVDAAEAADLLTAVVCPAAPGRSAAAASAPGRDCSIVATGGVAAALAKPQSSRAAASLQPPESVCRTDTIRVRPPRVAAPTKVPLASVVQPVLTPMAPL